MMKKILLSLLILTIAHLTYAQRDTISINDTWKFKTDPQNEGAKQHWSSKKIEGLAVNLPHTWQVANDPTLQKFYGWAWYQKTLKVPQNWKEKHIVLQFEAINHTAIIYLNGKEIAKHKGDGFSKFKINLDGLIKSGSDNNLTVAVNNEYSNEKVPYGSSFDWANDGGIIRPVSVIVSNKVSADQILLTPTLNLKDSSAQLKVQLKGIQLNKTNDLSWVISIKEENQATSKTIYNEKIIPKWNGDGYEAQLNLPQVHPWHFDFPNLYKIQIQAFKGSKLIDQISDQTGFRKTEFIKGKFYLNGEAIKLMGVEWTAGSNPDYGFAEPKAFIQLMGDRMKEVNCIFTRQHFQQSDVFYDFCDRKGILVQQEIPLWGPETPSNETIKGIAMNQITEMVANFYNHPSVFSWGVGNELRGRDAKMKSMIKAMIEKVRSLDPSRNVAYVSNSLTRGFYNNPKFVPDAAADGDYLMMNEYGASWWQLPAGQIGKYLDSVHLSYPDKPFLISEFGLCGPNFKGGDQRRLEDLIYHMALYESKDYIEGAIYFDLTDYRTHYPGTTEENKFRRRVHGIYDMYGNPKPSMRVLREQSSPIEAQTINGKGPKVKVSLFGAMGLPEHTVKGYQLYLTDSAGMKDFSKTKAYKIPDLKPGQNIELEIDNLYKGEGIITIVRPTGYIVSQKSFYRVLPEEKNF